MPWLENNQLKSPLAKPRLCFLCSHRATGPQSIAAGATKLEGLAVRLASVPCTASRSCPMFFLRIESLHSCFPVPITALSISPPCQPLPICCWPHSPHNTAFKCFKTRTDLPFCLTHLRHDPRSDLRRVLLLCPYSTVTANSEVPLGLWFQSLHFLDYLIYLYALQHLHDSWALLSAGL